MIACELCNRTGRIYCEADQATLCWECDAEVHGANFLAGRHTRVLLCRTCQAPTPWRSTGSRLCNSLTICEQCVLAEDDAMAEDEGGEDGDVEEGEGENQVVPQMSCPPPEVGLFIDEEEGNEEPGGSDLQLEDCQVSPELINPDVKGKKKGRKR